MKKVIVVILLISIIVAIAFGNQRIRESIWPKKLEIVDQNYTVFEIDNNGSIDYGINLVIDVKNSNKYRTSIQPIVIVTTINKAGKKIKTEQVSLPEIGPETTISYKSEEEMISSEKPAEVKCKIYPVPFQWGNSY